MTERYEKTGGSMNPLELTPRQHSIVSMLAQGMHNKKIASQLGITTIVIRSHIKLAVDKVGAQSTAQLMFWYGQRGAITKDSRGRNNQFVQRRREAA